MAPAAKLTSVNMALWHMSTSNTPSPSHIVELTAHVRPSQEVNFDPYPVCVFDWFLKHSNVEVDAEQLVDTVEKALGQLGVPS